MDTLKQNGLDQNTVIILTADHGEEFFEHGSKGHQRNLFVEEVKVPLIFKWPGHLPEKKRIGTVASIIDIMPTVLDLAEIPPSAYMMGTSLRAQVIEGREEPGRKALSELCWFNQPTYIYALRTDAAKIIYTPSTHKEAMFDVRSDPGEHENLATSDNVSALQAELEKDLLATIRNAKVRKEEWKIQEKLLRGITETQKQKLKSLGYMN